MQNLLAIFKVYYSFCRPACLPGEDKITPAMRVGLADHIVTIEELIESFSRGGKR